MRLIARRLAFGLFILLATSTLVFLATQALPSDPALAILGREASPQSLEAFQQQYGLDRSLLQQYWSWLSGIVRGDLGTSYATGDSVTHLIEPRLANTAVLAGVAGLVGVPLSLLIGIVAAHRRDSLLDHAVSGGSFVLLALPEFVIGTLLIFVFATGLFNIVPAVSFGFTGINDVSTLLLPCATLVLTAAPHLIRLTRSILIEVLESEYVQMARLKGVAEWLVVIRHSVPNAAAPVAQIVALVLAWLAGGVVIVEYLFNFPGMGSALVDAVEHRDVPVVQALVLVVAAVYVVVNLAADVVVVLTTPKARTSQ